MLCVQFLLSYIAHNWNYGILATPARTIVKTRLDVCFESSAQRLIVHLLRNRAKFTKTSTFSVTQEKVLKTLNCRQNFRAFVRFLENSKFKSEESDV